MQHDALFILEYLDVLAKYKREDRELRLALLSQGVIPADKLFPEIFGKPEGEVDENEFPDEEDAVTYVFADKASVDPQSIEEELRAMAAEAARGISTFDDSLSDWI